MVRTLYVVLVWGLCGAIRGGCQGDAVEMIAREIEPDVVVLDIMLPDFDGLEVMRRIRTEQPDVPVIFLTAKDGLQVLCLKACPL